MRSLGLILLTLIIGCASNGIRGVRTEALPSDQVQLSQPTLHQQDEGVQISGTASRKSGSTSPINGHVNISIINAKGEVTDEIPASLVPAEIPARGQGHSSYNVLVNRKLHSGWGVRVEFSDADGFAPYGSHPVSYGERARMQAVGGLGRTSSGHSNSGRSGGRR